jgi:hypothetical protein
MKKLFFCVVLTYALTAPLASQDTGDTLYVSQIGAESRNNLIRITWVDSPDARGPVYIFRAARPFSGSIPANIRPVVRGYGEQYYIDDAEDLEGVYYFIAASDTAGLRYDIILPQVNSIYVIVGETSVAQAPVAPEPGISNLRASRDGERVVVVFDTYFPRRNAVLYRSMQPVRQPQDLLNAVLVQSGISSPFADFPVPGITWYYTVVYEDDISSGNMRIRPGINSTTSAVVVSTDDAQRTLRPIPLPVMTLRDIMPDGFFLSDVSNFVPLSEQSARMLEGLPSKEPLTLKTPRVFVVDLDPPSSGEESALFQIVKDFFQERDWEGSRTALSDYLSLPRSRDVEARARFYLGQALYFTGNYREALFEFLWVKSLHQDEANMWIDATLTAMVY